MSKKLTFNNMAFNCITDKFVTDKNLNPSCEGLNIVIHQPDHILDGMGEWCTKNHGESGRKNYFYSEIIVLPLFFPLYLSSSINLFSSCSSQLHCIMTYYLCKECLSLCQAVW